MLNVLREGRGRLGYGNWLFSYGHEVADTMVIRFFSLEHAAITIPTLSRVYFVRNEYLTDPGGSLRTG